MRQPADLRPGSPAAAHLSASDAFERVHCAAIYDRISDAVLNCAGGRVSVELISRKHVPRHARVRPVIWITLTLQPRLDDIERLQNEDAGCTSRCARYQLARDVLAEHRRMLCAGRTGIMSALSHPDGCRVRDKVVLS